MEKVYRVLVKGFARNVVTFGVANSSSFLIGNQIIII